MSFKYKVTALHFIDYKSDAARRIMDRLGCERSQGGGRLSDGSLRYYIDDKTTATRRDVIPVGDRLSIEVGIDKGHKEGAPTKPDYICVGVLVKASSSDSAQRILKRLGVTPTQRGHQESSGYFRYYVTEPNAASDVAHVYTCGKLGFLVGLAK